MEYKGIFLFAFTETWLKDQHKSSDLEIDRLGVPFCDDLTVTNK